MTQGDDPTADKGAPATAQGRTVIVPADATIMAGHPQGGPQSAAAAAPTGDGVDQLAPGTLINNNYRIVALVSAGGMGAVYRAENLFTGDPVAVKVILPGLAGDAAVLDLFRREARVLVQLRDEAIVRYHNFILDPDLGRYCLIMEYVEGRHLGARLKAEGALNEAETLALMRRLGAGLLRAHDSGVTHRDLSPDNVILRDERIDEAVLIDFGIARSTELGDGLSGRFAGKFKYIAPEQLGHGGGVIDARTDVYGLALLIAAVARGAPLEMGDCVISASAARQAIPDLGGISHRLFPLLQHMLEPDPAQRPVDMAAVLRMLDDPSLIPSRYRLPLWRPGGASGPAGDGVVAAGAMADAVALDPSASPFGASSPFGAARPADKGGAMVRDTADMPAPRRRLAVMIAGGVALAALLAAGAWLGPLAGDRGGAGLVAETPPVTPPTTLVARDPRTREGFLADQPLGPCALAQRIDSGPDAGQLLILGPADTDASALVETYRREFGVSPAVQQREITPAQCPAIAFLRDMAGRPAPPVTMQAQIRATDSQQTGAQLEVRGTVDAGAGRSLWLFLVPPDGDIYDLSAQLPPEAFDPARAGAGTAQNLGFALAQSGAVDGPYLLVAVTTDAPIAAVAAAPAGIAAEQILPRVSDELHQAGAAPAISILPLSDQGIAMREDPG